MPWKGEKDPYQIWLSEIILQQTRVDQGLAYYNDLLGNFQLFRIWQKRQRKKCSNFGKDWAIIQDAGV